MGIISTGGQTGDSKDLIKLEKYRARLFTVIDRVLHHSLSSIICIGDLVFWLQSFFYKI